MPDEPRALLFLAGLVAAAAVLYASVGHGGASAYLAAMALFGVPAAIMKPAALVMNLGVAGMGTLRFAAFRLAMRSRTTDLRPPPAALALVAIGIVFGFVAGLTGVGGGIFLSP